MPPRLIEWAAAFDRPLLFYDIDTPITLTGLADGECEYLRPELVPLFDEYLSFTGGPALVELRER
jgi:hypothetical protein